ncbi:MAG: hypothetical protein ISR58_15325 [Anaerolineales bacterium]|nr:hypothetical protein [Anaerolineales bacterium]
MVRTNRTKSSDFQKQFWGYMLALFFVWLLFSVVYQFFGSTREQKIYNFYQLDHTTAVGVSYTLNINYPKKIPWCDDPPEGDPIIINVWRNDSNNNSKRLQTILVSLELFESGIYFYDSEKEIVAPVANVAIADKKFSANPETIYACRSMNANVSKEIPLEIRAYDSGIGFLNVRDEEITLKVESAGEKYLRTVLDLILELDFFPILPLLTFMFGIWQYTKSRDDQNQRAKDEFRDKIKNLDQIPISGLGFNWINLYQDAKKFNDVEILNETINEFDVCVSKYPEWGRPWLIDLRFEIARCIDDWMDNENEQDFSERALQKLYSMIENHSLGFTDTELITLQDFLESSAPLEQGYNSKVIGDILFHRGFNTPPLCGVIVLRHEPSYQKKS